MPDNNQIASLFEKMAVLCELNGDNVFKVRAYQKAALILKNLERDASVMSIDELIAIKGIGKSIAAHIKEISEKGSFSEFEELKSKYPAGLLELTEIRGLGAKRAKILYEKLKIDSVNKLYEAAKSKKIRELDGFGEKFENSIIEAIEKKSALPQRFLYHNAIKIAREIVAWLKNNGYKKVEYAGSLRRRKDTIGDIDILYVGDVSGMVKFAKSEFVKDVLSLGQQKASFILKNNIQCDIRVFKENEFGAALCYFTGSKAHNIRLREIALKRNLILNEYGLFSKSSKEKIAGKFEEDIYKKLGLVYIPPELREDSGEIEMAQSGKEFDLVELKDIKGDIHCHSAYTDGANSIDEICDYLSKRYRWAYIGDHSVPLNFVKGLDFKSYIKTRNEVLSINKKYKNKFFERSVELEILKNGELAFEKEQLKDVSLVIAAVHTSLRLNRKEQTERMIKAINNPYCDVVAHLTQRIINERDEMDMDYDRIFEVAAENGTIFEVNGQPDRMDLNDVNIKRVISLGLKVVLSSDAHSIEQFDYIEYSLNNVRRAGLSKKDVLNCLDFKEFKDFIEENRKRRGGL